MTRVSQRIYRNIKDSDIFIDYKNLRLYFSSDFNKSRFENKIIKFINDENIKLKIKYNVEVEFSEMLLISFYKKIEKRGFKVYKRNINLLTSENSFINVSEYDIINSKVGD